MGDPTGTRVPLERFAAARSARLATVSATGGPHLVPVVFAVDGRTIHMAVDGKPKSTRQLRRLANIEHNAQVCLLVDEYTEDWEQLWWVRADGHATIHTEGPAVDRTHQLLRAKYPQYATVPLDGAVIVVDVTRWSSWDATGPA
jgi:PPOX class probable F420-dependent enzyme